MAPQLRTPVKRRRAYDEEDNEPSDSELSDIDDLEETALAEPEVEDDEDEDDEEEESSDSETPEGEVEEPYISDEQPDISDEDDDSDVKPLAKSVAQRTVGGGRRTAAAKHAAKPKKPAATKKVGKRTIVPVSSPPQKLRQLPQRTTHTRSSAAVGTRSSFQQGKTASSKQTTSIPTTKSPTIKLKIGKERLREITSAWTPPPGATDTGAPSTAAATPEPVAAPVPKSTPIMPRGRKVVQEDSDDDEEEEDEEDEEEGEEDESKVDEEQEPEDELGDEDAEGETDDELLDSDEEMGATPGTDFMSGAGTPDMSRLTNRQRTRLGDITIADLLELPSGFEKPGANKVVSLSAQEQELKRAEMARRRKNLTDQKLEEEKIDTINRLLKKQTPKMRGRGRATGDATPADQNIDTIMGGAEPPPAPTMARWVSNKDGIRLAVPGSWLEGPLGRRFEPQTQTDSMRNVRRKLVEEV